MNEQQEMELLADVKQARDTSMLIHAKLEERCPTNERRISRLEKAFIAIASTIILGVLAAALTGFIGA